MARCRGHCGNHFCGADNAKAVFHLVDRVEFEAGQGVNVLRDVNEEVREKKAEARSEERIYIPVDRYSILGRAGGDR